MNRETFDELSVNRCPIDIHDATIVDDKIWFFSTNYNGLHSVDMRTQEIAYHGNVPWEEMQEENLYFSMLEHNRKLYLVPYWASSIAIYDIETNSFNEIKISSGDRKKQFYYGACFQEENLWLFPSMSSCILCVNTLDGVVYEVYAKERSMEEYITDPHDVYFQKQTICQDNKIYAPMNNANVILEIDCIAKQYVCHVISGIEHGFWGICQNKDELWLASWGEKSEMICWHPKKGVYKRIRGKLPNSGKQCVGCECFDNKMHIYSAESKNVEFENEIIQVTAERSYFARRVGEYILSYDIDKHALKVNCDKLKMILPIYIDYAKTPLADAFLHKAVDESNAQRLERLIECVERKKTKSDTVCENIGMNIYRAVI